MDKATKKRKATYEDVIDSPPNKLAEIIGGELRLNKRPRTPGLMATTALVGELGSRFARGCLEARAPAGSSRASAG